MYEAHQSRNNCLTQRSSGASLRSLALTTLRPLNFALGASQPREYFKSKEVLTDARTR
jgi:hypothetical protein